MGDSTAIRLVLFRLGQMACALPAAGVREVIPAVRSTRIPGTAGISAGLVNLRGSLLTVVDGRRLVGFDGALDEPESVLVLDQYARPVGLTVDEVLDLIEVRADTLKAGDPPSGIDPRLVQAVGRVSERAFVVLDTAALLAPHLG
jgi:purine-binding chemotaxis protein CheW